MQISTLFHQDAKLLNELVMLLTKEQTSLVNMDIDVVERIIDEKSMVIQKITEATKIRHQALGKAGFDANENGMVSWVRANEDKKIHATWADFQKKLTQAKELNRVNGQVINQHFKRNQEALNVLHGKAANAGSSVYGPNGQTSTHSMMRASLSA
jgi:flagellar biosynthesis protein FlgN